MLTGGIKGKRLLAGAALIAVAGLVSPTVAAAKHRVPFSQRDARDASCPPSKDLLRVDTKVCPATPRRGSIILHRACCQNRKGKVMCKHFEHCPKRSPS